MVGDENFHRLFAHAAVMKSITRRPKLAPWSANGRTAKPVPDAGAANPVANALSLTGAAP
jgi:hypothetical protein